MNAHILVGFILFCAIFRVRCYTDLENFIRIGGSLDPNVSTVDYFNGSVYAKVSGHSLQKLFNFEGYNINRKLLQNDSTFLSLSREFVVYRHPVTSEILQVFSNPISGKANEVFYVANDPVNGIIDSAPRSFVLPENQPQVSIYNSDYVLEYPNPLTPDKYKQYSAGTIYDAVELFAYIVNIPDLQTDNKSIPMCGTWMRKSEFLPWMELSTTPGSLFYTTLVWKCMDGLQCVSSDIMNLIKSNFSKYQTAPSTDEQPNETSWTAFKKTIDQRRLAGLPDIIIPDVNISSNARAMVYNIDKRVSKILTEGSLTMSITGSAQSEIAGISSHILFDANGVVHVTLQPEPHRSHADYSLQFIGNLVLLNHTTGEPLEVFDNPITGQSIDTSHIYNQSLNVSHSFSKDSLFTIDMPSFKAVGLIGANSPAEEPNGAWEVNLFNFIFPYEELSKDPTQAHFYGSFSTFKSWPDWMKMHGISGNVVSKFTASKF